MSLSPELAALRDEAMAMTCEAWAIRKRWTLAKGTDRAGPCPVCGGTDRFSIHTRKNTFFCRRCEASGHGVIALVMWTENKGFVEACEIVTGRQASAPVDERRLAELRAKAEADEQRRAAEAAAYREKARLRGYEIWRAAAGNAGRATVATYLERRGLVLPEAVLRSLREAPAHPYYEPLGRGEGARVLHCGPAMLAAVQLPDGRFGAVHQTWIDLGQPKGKLALPSGPEGKPRPAKKVLGAKKGGAIRLYTPERPRRLVMGEGIETTLTPFVHAFEAETAYWAGVDLGNMAGRAARDADGGMLHDVPDLDDRECFLPPEWCRELVYLAEGDEPSKHPVEKAMRGLRRAAALCPDIETWLVPPPDEGGDMNDLVRVEN